MLTLLFLFLGCGIINTLVAVPLWLELVKPNPIYGFRVRATLENPQVWYAVNRYFGQRFVWAGPILMVSALLLYFIPGISIDTYALACMLVFMLALTIIMAQSMRYLKSLSHG